MSKMTGIKNELHTIVCEAIRLTKVDFGVICGLRTQEEQDALLAKGATQTKTSKHMTSMRKDMRAGKTFTQAHKNAMKKVGK